MTFDEIIEEYTAFLVPLIDAESIIEASEADPVEPVEVTDEEISQVSEWWDSKKSELYSSIKEEANADGLTPDDIEPDSAMEEALLAALLIALLKARNRIHLATVSLHISDEDREEEIKKATDEAALDIQEAVENQTGALWLETVTALMIANAVQYYIYRTQGDSKVRPTHRQLNGRVFSLDDPPPSGHPKTEYNCRCYMQLITNEQALRIAASNKAENKANQMQITLINSNTMIINGDIGENNEEWGEGSNNTAHGLMEAASQLDTTGGEIRIIIGSSRGGVISDIEALIAYIDTLGVKIITENYGQASSAALSLFLKGDERIWHPKAQGLAHLSRVCDCACFRAQDLEEAQSQLSEIDEAIIDYYVERTGQDREAMAELLKNETNLNAKSALIHGFATSIAGDQNQDALNVVNKFMASVSNVAAPQNAAKLIATDDNIMPDKNEAAGEKLGLKAKLEFTENTLKNLQTSHDELENKAASQAEAVNKLTAEKAELNAKLAELEAVKIELDKRDMADLVAKVDGLNVDFEGVETLEDGLRAALKAVNFPDAETIPVGSLSNMLDFALKQTQNPEATAQNIAAFSDQSGTESVKSRGLGG